MINIQINIQNLGKRQRVRLYSLRDTVILREQGGVMIERPIPEGHYIQGMFYLPPCELGDYACIYVDDGTMPLDYWHVLAPDFTWEAMVPVEIS